MGSCERVLLIEDNRLGFFRESFFSVCIRLRVLSTTDRRRRQLSCFGEGVFFVARPWFAVCPTAANIARSGGVVSAERKPRGGRARCARAYMCCGWASRGRGVVPPQPQAWVFIVSDTLQQRGVYYIYEAARVRR